jgi:hypothetical protein
MHDGKSQAGLQRTPRAHRLDPLNQRPNWTSEGRPTRLGSRPPRLHGALQKLQTPDGYFRSLKPAGIETSLSETLLDTETSS